MVQKYGVPDTNDNMPKLECDKLHMKFLKYICGTHKRATNYAILGELGRYPLYIDVLLNSIKYFQRLNMLADENKLVSKALHENLSMKENNKKCWIKDVHLLLRNIGITETDSSDLFINVKNKLISNFKEKWKSTLSENCSQQTGKLRTYATFKTIFGREKYFSVIKNREVRKCFTKFRISAHVLEIERGRYKKIDVNNRICKFCTLGAVEDEHHFIFSCPLYNNKREDFMCGLINNNNNFENLSNNEKLIWLMSNEDDDVILDFSNYIYNCFKIRKNEE